MEQQRTAVETIVGLTGYERDVVTALVRRFYLAGIHDPKRLIFKALQAMKA